MEEEINYVSEKIEALDNKIAELYDNINKGYGVGGRIGQQYKDNIKKMTDEKSILENIIAFLKHTTI